MQKAWFILLIFVVACGQKNQSSVFPIAKTQINAATESKGKVLMFLSPDCPLCHNYSLEFKQLANSYPELDFYGIFTGQLYSDAELNHYIDSFKFYPPMLSDPYFELAREYLAQVTPHFYLLDSANEIAYSGKMDNWAISLGRKKIKADSFYLKWAIESFLHGEKIVHSKTEPVGCMMEYP